MTRSQRLQRSWDYKHTSSWCTSEHICTWWWGTPITCEISTADGRQSNAPKAGKLCQLARISSDTMRGPESIIRSHWSLQGGNHLWKHPDVAYVYMHLRASWPYSWNVECLKPCPRTCACCETQKLQPIHVAILVWHVPRLKKQSSSKNQRDYLHAASRMWKLKEKSRWQKHITWKLATKVKQEKFMSAAKAVAQMWNQSFFDSNPWHFVYGTHNNSHFDNSNHDKHYN